LASEPALLWTAPAGRGAAGPPAIGDSVIAIVTTDGALIVLSRATGEKIWSDRLDSPGITGPLVSGDRIFSATADGHVYAHDLPTGRTIWERRSTPLVGPLALAGGRLIVATAGGQVMSLDPARGTVTWRRELGQVLRSGPAVGDGRAVIASDDSLYALDLTAGALLTSAPARGMALNPPARTGNLLIYGSPEGAVAAFDATTLAPAWRIETDHPVVASAVVARDTVVAVTATGTLWSIPVAAPQSATSVALGVTVRATPAPIADGVLVATIAGEILRIAPPVSEPRWRTRVDGPLTNPPVVDRGLLVFVDGRGRIQAWK
jgi:outer membrane protein assembly factor BamB